MTVQWSTAVRNAVLDAWETAMGASIKVQLRSGAAPANCAAADTGTLIAEFPLSADWASAAANGIKGLSGLPLSVNAAAAGTLGHYRFKDSAGATCHEQGTITATSGGGDMTVDNTSVNAGQQIQITAYSKTAPGA